jgi:hypothetical protein
LLYRWKFHFQVFFLPRVAAVITHHTISTAALLIFLIICIITQSNST